MVSICYQDADVLVCIKPPRVLSTDEPGGLPELIRRELGDLRADIRTVHRLDRVVSGLMVLSRNPASASNLSRQVREGSFQKTYLAVVHGIPEEPEGLLRDLLGRDKARKMTFVSDAPGKGIQEASLYYSVLESKEGMSLVRIRLHTGRTHQIRVQFASRGMPLVGERKYSERNDPCEIALFSHSIGFEHPVTGETMTFAQKPPAIYPWNLFQFIGK